MLTKVTKTHKDLIQDPNEMYEACVAS